MASPAFIQLLFQSYKILNYHNFCYWIKKLLFTFYFLEWLIQPYREQKCWQNISKFQHFFSFQYSHCSSPCFLLALLMCLLKWPVFTTCTALWNFSLFSSSLVVSSCPEWSSPLLQNLTIVSTWRGPCGRQCLYKTAYSCPF